MPETQFLERGIRFSPTSITLLARPHGVKRVEGSALEEGLEFGHFSEPLVNSSRIDIFKFTLRPHVRRGSET